MSPSSKRERLLLLLRGLRAASLDAIAHLGAAGDRRALALAADEIHDASLVRCVAVAALGAEEAEVGGCGCAARFDRVIRLGQDAQRADAVEDGQYGAAFAEVDQGRSRIRVVAGRFDRLLTGRSE